MKKNIQSISITFSKKKPNGFTLIETAIALGFLTVGFLVLISLSTNYMKTLTFARERTMATFLSQEGIEAVLAKRNENFKQGSNDVWWLEGLAIQTENQSTVCIDGTLTTVLSCSDDGSKLYRDAQGFYMHTPSADTQVFSRKIILRPLDAATFETAKIIEASSQVSFMGKQVELKTLMTQWNPLSN
ncbi:MAG: hypothetical protein UU76_C0016G0015 [Parcubacteria group bacterium GW2011_GWC1_41_7]|nr:MAG: hypothetical protein UU76_C0016G0015 [Parcubacteria group bacterium GW2011_GWC1_41_7]